MTAAYLFRAALLCPDCAAVVLASDARPGHVVDGDESTWDSDEWPKGPFPDGGGEADTPQHCDSCGAFLNNPLTPDGVAYVRDLSARGYVPAAWAAAYPFALSSPEKESNI